jgi:drug/metabolite transporter (DMT)-like permease
MSPPPVSFGGVTRRSWVLFSAMCVIWGIPYLLIRVAVRELDPAAVVFARTAIGALLLTPIAIWRRQLGALRGHWGWLLVYTGFELTMPWYLLTSAEEHLTSSLAGLLVAAVPLVGVILGWVVGGAEPVGGRRLTGLVIGVIGVAALVGLQVGDIDMVAVLEVFFVAVGYAVGPLVLSRRLADLPSMAVVSVSLLITAIVYAPFALTSHPGHVGGKAIASVLTLAIVCTALAFLIFFALIADIGPVRATVITYVNPAVAILLGVTILGEHLTAGMIVGFPLVLIGSVFATGRAQRRRATRAAEPESMPAVTTG